MNSIFVNISESGMQLLVNSSLCFPFSSLSHRCLLLVFEIRRIDAILSSKTLNHVTPQLLLDFLRKTPRAILCEEGSEAVLVVVVVLKEVSGLVPRVSRGAHLSLPLVVIGLGHGQEHLEVLHPWERGDRGLEHGLAADLDVVLHAELHVSGQVHVVEHRVPLVSGGGALAGERCSRALLGVLLFRLHVAVIIIQRPGFVQVFLCVGKEIHGV